MKGYDFQAIVCAMIESSKGEDMKKIQEPLSTYCILVFCRAPGVLDIAEDAGDFRTKPQIIYKYVMIMANCFETACAEVS